MKEPNFGECQIQECLNTEFALWALQKDKKIASAMIPTLHEEKLLGWDSGFFFPWLPWASLDDQHGCNFFLQYKLSTLIEGTGGGQYPCWKEPYFRFKIPHQKRENGHLVDDFHQYYALRALADRECDVYYATNQVTTRDELLGLANDQALIDNTPFLDVCDVAHPHRYVTFTESSKHFFLHSEPVLVERVTGDAIKARIAVGDAHSLAEDNALVFEILRKQLSDILGAEKEFLAYEKFASSRRTSSVLREVRRFYFLRSTLLRYFNISMLRVRL